MKFTHPRVCIVLSTVLLLVLAAGCAQEPPFEVESAAARLERAQGGFGTAILKPSGVDEVLVHRLSARSADGAAIPVDVYYPQRFPFRGAHPAVFVSCGSPDWSYTISLGQALAASGLIAVVPDTRHFPNDFPRVIADMRERAEELFLYPGRIGIWAEGHVSPCALEATMNADHGFHDALAGTVFLSPVLFMGEEQSLSLSPSELCADVPVFVARAADDEFYEVRATVQSFRAAAEEAGVPLTFSEVPAGGHNWMSDAQTEPAREVFRDAIAFLEKRL